MANLLSLQYANSSYNILGIGTNDGHGGHGEEHKEMMEQIANEIADKKI